MNKYYCRSGATVLASGYVLTAFVPRPAELLAALGRPRVWVASVGPDAAAGTVCGVLLWLIALWFSFAAVLTFLASAPGRLGVFARSVASWMTPAVLRRVLIATAGASIVASPATAFASSVGATPAPTGTPPSTSILVPSAPAPILPTDQPSSTTELDVTRPVGSLAGTLPSVGWPVDPTPSPIAGRSAPPGIQPAGTDQRVTVRPGDSLWSIAAHRLGPARTEGQICVEWPRWYTVNRGLIGADPDLLLAGTKLRVPQPAHSSEER